MCRVFCYADTLSILSLTFLEFSHRRGRIAIVVYRADKISWRRIPGVDYYKDRDVTNPAVEVEFAVNTKF